MQKVPLEVLKNQFDPVPGVIINPVDEFTKAASDAVAAAKAKAAYESALNKAAISRALSNEASDRAKVSAKDSEDAAQALESITEKYERDIATAIEEKGKADESVSNAQLATFLAS